MAFNGERASVTMIYDRVSKTKVGRKAVVDIS